MEDEMPRRRGRRDGDEGESLDDMLSSVPHIEAMDDGGLEGDDYPDMVDEAGVRIPSGRQISTVTLVTSILQWVFGHPCPPPSLGFIIAFVNTLSLLLLLLSNIF